LRPLPSRLEAGLYRAAQESVRNALEHGAPGRVVVRLVVTAETARLSVEDDGTGFDVAAETPERWGLVGLNERVRLLGGELSVQSEAGRGTRIEATIPLKEICGVG
jgi:signal transduction histidine kinase